MKKLLSILLLFISLGAFAQTYDTLPTGSKPYGNQLYLSPTGLIIGGTGSAKFRVIGTKKYVDSLLALKLDALNGDRVNGSDNSVNFVNGTINNTNIGGSIPATGVFNTLTATVAAFVPTVATADNSTKAASTQYVTSKIAAIPVTDLTPYQLKSEKAQPNGYASLNPSGKVPLTQIDDALLGAVNYRGVYNATTNTPALPAAASENKGYYYIVSTAGTQFSLNLAVGDWIISNGSVYGKVDNNNSVTSVAGRTGAVVVTKADVLLGNSENTSDLNKVVSTATQTALNLKANLAAGNTFEGVQILNSTPNIKPVFREIAGKGRYVDVLNNDGNVILKRQIAYWNGSAFVATDNIFSGYQAGQSNTGSNIGSISGYSAGQSNTGSDIGSISGYGAGSNNTGSYIGSISGFIAGQHNSGSNIGAFSGSNAGRYNTGSSIGSISGVNAGQSNTGSDIGSISGYGAGSNNTGSYIGSISGVNAGRYNAGNKSTIVGDNAYSIFIQNIAGIKSFDYTAINTTAKTITINSHGFGSAGSYRNLFFTQGTSAITGLANTNIIQVKIQDANTLLYAETLPSGQLRFTNNITDAGTGTGHSFTPSVTYNNLNILGADVIPTGSNQTWLGSDLTTQTFIQGATIVNTKTDNGVDKLQVNGSINTNSLLKVGQFTTATEPVYIKGAQYFNTTTNKLKVGGISAWEEVAYSSEVAGVPNATPTVLGKIQLAGDLGGTATAPTVPNKVDKVSGSSLISDASITRLANTSGTNTGDNATNTQYSNLASSKENTITAGTTAQYFRGDKTFQTLDKSTIGLANVENTSDANKPISTATQTALNLKANNSALVAGQTIGANTTGTAGTAINWGGKSAQFGAGITSVSGILAIDADGVAREANPSKVKTYLSTSLQEVTNVSGITNNSIFVTGNSRVATPTGRTLGIELTNSYATIFGYNYTTFTGIDLALAENGGNVGIGITTPTAKLDVVGNGKFSGTVTAPLFNGSATLSGTPTAPTATAGTNTTQIATTAYVDRAISSTTVASGFYSPAIFVEKNTSGLTAAPYHYIRVGNQVTVTGTVVGSAQQAGQTMEFRVSLPIASDLISSYDLTGHGSTDLVSTPSSVSIVASMATDTAYVVVGATPLSTTFTTFFSFTYTIQQNGNF